MALDAWIGNWLNPAFAARSLKGILPELECPVIAMHGADEQYGTLRHPQIISELLIARYESKLSRKPDM